MLNTKCFLFLPKSVLDTHTPTHKQKKKRKPKIIDGEKKRVLAALRRQVISPKMVDFNKRNSRKFSKSII